MTKPEQARGPEENDKVNSILDVIELYLDDYISKKGVEKETATRELIDILANKYDVSLDKDSGLVAERILVPIEIFSYDLSPLEALVKFLRENKEMSVSKIATKLNRDSTTIWTTYNNSLKKLKTPLMKQRADSKFEEEGTRKIPLEKFGNRVLSVFEVVVLFLKEKGMKYSEIGKVLNRDQRNIWSTYARAKKKMGSPDKDKNSEKEVKDE